MIATADFVCHHCGCNLIRGRCRDYHPYTIQCTDAASAVIGCFLYDPHYPKVYGHLTATSPVFRDLADLYTWAEANHLQLAHYGRKNNAS